MIFMYAAGFYVNRDWPFFYIQPSHVNTITHFVPDTYAKNHFFEP